VSLSGLASSRMMTKRMMTMVVPPVELWTASAATPLEVAEACTRKVNNTHCILTCIRLGLKA